ncbi:MAG: amidoligase family protein [Rhodobacterales bacterium]
MSDLQARIPLDRFWPMPVGHKACGQPRRTGIEIEFANLTEAEAAKVVHELWGGTICAATAHEITVKDTELGDVRIELDMFLRDKAGHAVTDKLLDWSRAVVPVEIVTDPLTHAQLPRVEALITDLVAAGAAGSQDGVFYGFGLHLNPEITAETAAGVLPVIRAYGLLEDWLRAIDPVDPSRRLLPFVDPWPRSLLDALAETAATWGLDDLARSYAALSPTRNRGLDLLPLLEHLRPDIMAAGMEADKLKGGRPTYHYRLPEARLGAAGWSLAYEWNRWILVERVAADPALLDRLAQEWRAHRGALTSLRADWAKTVNKVLAAAQIWT